MREPERGAPSPRHMSQWRGSEQHDTGNTTGVRIKAEGNLLGLQLFLHSLTRAVQRPSEGKLKWAHGPGD